jgi:hypothetical protein
VLLHIPSIVIAHFRLDSQGRCYSAIAAMLATHCPGCATVFVRAASLSLRASVSLFGFKPDTTSDIRVFIRVMYPKYLGIQVDGETLLRAPAGQELTQAAGVQQ